MSEKRKLLPDLTNVTWSSLDTKFTYNQLQLKLRNLNHGNPRLWLYLTGIGISSFLLSLKSMNDAAAAENEIAFRKAQLSKEIYELQGDNAINFPWNKENLHDWLYRPVRVTGRPIHRDTMMIPQKVANYHGYNYIVPLVTKEDDDGSNKSGILLNDGWIPHEYKHPESRHRLESVRPQTFIAYLTLNKEHDEKSSFFKKGNQPIYGRNSWGHVYLPDMAHYAGFKNEEKAKLALLETVKLDSPLDERDSQHYDVSLGQKERFPYQKTRAGALQLPKMPWDYKKESKEYATLGLLTTGFALALKLLV